MRILFMGTPDFAVPSFNKLADCFEVVGAVTQPDKPKGRHMSQTPSAVKIAALKRGIPVFQPTTLKDGAFLNTLQSLAPDVIVVVAYGKILPKYLLDFPAMGCINLHGSLLPKYRGAAPMQRAIINGEDVIGVTTMYMAEGLDTGDMLEKASFPLSENDNFETVHDKLAEIGASLLFSTLNGLAKKALSPTKQDDALSSYAAKIENDDCVLRFNQSARTIFNQIRGLSPFPLAFCKHNGRMLKIIDSRVVIDDKEILAKATNAAYGEVLSLEKDRIVVKCKDSLLAILALLPEGKSRMKAADYINGRKIAVGDILQ